MLLECCCAGSATLLRPLIAPAFLLPPTQAPSVWVPLQLVGATAGATIAFLLPGMLALHLARWRWAGGGAGGLLLLLAGLLLFAAGTAAVALRL